MRARMTFSMCHACTQEILHDLLPSKVVQKILRDQPDAKSSCETRRVVVLVLDLCNFTKIS